MACLTAAISSGEVAELAATANAGAGFHGGACAGRPGKAPVVALTWIGALGFTAIDGELSEGLRASGADGLFLPADFCSGLCSPTVFSAAFWSVGFFSEALCSGALRS